MNNDIACLRTSSFLSEEVNAWGTSCCTQFVSTRDTGSLWWIILHTPKQGMCIGLLKRSTYQNVWNYTYHSLLHQRSGAQNNSLCMFEKADEQGFTVIDFLCLLSFSLPLIILWKNCRIKDTARSHKGTVNQLLPPLLLMMPQLVSLVPSTGLIRPPDLYLEVPPSKATILWM